MDLNKKKKKSKNFEDHTGYSELQRFLDSMLTRLNPVYAYRNIRNEGVIPASKGVKLRKY